MDKKRVLIVEDDTNLSEILTTAFSEAGFFVLHSESGAASLVSAFSQHPDCILLDILLPDMNGVEVLKRLRENTWGKSVPVIMLTNVSPDEFITKSIVRDEPAFYLIKAESSVDDIIAKTREAIGV